VREYDLRVITLALCSPVTCIERERGGEIFWGLDGVRLHGTQAKRVDRDLISSPDHHIFKGREQTLIIFTTSETRALLLRRQHFHRPLKEHMQRTRSPMNPLFQRRITAENAKQNLSLLLQRLVIKVVGTHPLL
jgi:hypothetical protein